MKVKFDLKYRQQIESGEYKVETVDGRQVRIVCWDAHNPYRENDIVALATSSSGEGENILRYYSNGHLISDSANVGNKDLMVIIPDDYERIRKIITDSVFYQYGAGVEYKDVLDYLDNLEKQKEPENVSASTMIPSCWETEQKERSPLTKEDEYILNRIIEHLEDEGYHSEWVELLQDIHNLLYQKEQKSADKPDLVAELKHHLATTPKEQLEKEWKELEHWNNIGPTVEDFLYGKPLEWSEEDEKILHAIELYVGQLDSGETINGFSGSDMLRVLKSLRPQPKQEWSEDKYPKNIETDAVMFCFDNGLNVTPYQAKMIAKHYYELGFKRIGNGKA